MTEVEPIQRSVTVPLEPAAAFELFTARMDAWWPVQTHSRAEIEFEDEDVHVVRVEFQAATGGKILEHLTDGRVLPWAEIVTWEPPHRFVMAWKPHSRPQPPTEVEVRFTARDGGTLVELVHRGWERLSEPRAPEIRAGYSDGWIETLSAFVAAAEREVA